MSKGRKKGTHALKQAEILHTGGKNSVHTAIPTAIVDQFIFTQVIYILNM